jgi:hypothetical protein
MTVYPKEYDNIVQPVTAQHLTNPTANYHLPLTKRRLLENMIKDPISEFFLNKKNPDICSEVAGYISSDEIFSFSNDKNSRPSNFLFQIARYSGATLSECPFSVKKRTSLKRLL